MSSGSPARTTALHAWHVAAGARMGDFAGWQMPLEYPAGTVTEHRAVRAGCGVFDVSHMGNLTIRAADDEVNRLLTNDISGLAAGDVQYTMMCDAGGGVIDDMLVTRMTDGRLEIVPNAANTPAVRGALVAAAGDRVTDHTEDTAIIAVQGPAAPEVLAAVGLPAGHPYMTAVEAERDGHPVVVSRTGYTGEHGYELILPAAAAPALWEDLVDVPQVTPAGLGARDTLRTEMGYALHGHEIGPDISPVAAGLAWAVAWEKPDFTGRPALLAERGDSGGRRLRGLLLTDRGVPRPEMTVRMGERTVGMTTSGTFSPSLKQGIALALLARDVVPGDQVSIDVRGRSLAATVVKPPFVDSSPR